YYYRARTYSPRLGRFLSHDPLGFDAGDYNLYRYAFDNPANLTDPSGQIVPLIAIPLIIGGGALIVDWGVQVYRNVECRGMSFWDAVYHENLNIREMAAVGVGAGAGTIAGMTVAALLPAATTFWGAVGVGTASGSVGGGAGRITTNVILPDTAWQEGVPQSMFWGGVTGGVLGGAGFGVRQWWAGRATARAAQHYLDDLPEPKTMVRAPSGQINSRVMAELQRITGDEFALARVGGERVLIRGYSSGTWLPPDTTRLIAHTHPLTDPSVSGMDQLALDILEQMWSLIIMEDGNVFKFFPR
ncbi:MAG: hypothetical protein DRI81_20260, partial [Chloroflexi bacterium]